MTIQRQFATMPLHRELGHNKTGVLKKKYIIRRLHSTLHTKANNRREKVWPYCTDGIEKFIWPIV